jgi:hypothetical protein
MGCASVGVCGVVLWSVLEGDAYLPTYLPLYESIHYDLLT